MHYFTNFISGITGYERLYDNISKNLSIISEGIEVTSTSQLRDVTIIFSLLVHTGATSFSRAVHAETRKVKLVNCLIGAASVGAATVLAAKCVRTLMDRGCIYLIGFGHYVPSDSPCYSLVGKILRQSDLEGPIILP